MINTDDEVILGYLANPAQRENGFRMLVAKYKERLYYHIRRIVNLHEDADDVLQNTFIKVAKNINGFQSNSSLYTWLYTIATNEGLNYLKSKANRKFESMDNVSHQIEANDYEFNENEAVNILQNAVDTLPEKQKMVFLLRYYEELPYHEIAEITATSEGALKTSYHIAVKKIEQYIKQTNE